jgi:hypothetical protein
MKTGWLAAMAPIASTDSLRSSACPTSVVAEGIVRTNGESYSVRYSDKLTSFVMVRFAKKQYSNIEIVQTEKKGFGLRAGENISKSVHSRTTKPRYSSIFIVQGRIYLRIHWRCDITPVLHEAHAGLRHSRDQALLLHDASAGRVHRCNETWGYRSFCEPQLCAELLCGEVDRRRQGPDGHLCE